MTSSAIASTVGGMIRPSLFEKYWIDPNLAFGASDAHEPDMISASPAAMRTVGTTVLNRNRGSRPKTNCADTGQNAKG